MPDQPLFFVGALIAALGWITFMSLVFASGGRAKSRQFGAIWRIFRGDYGSARRLVAAGSLLVVAIGTCVLFAGVSASDGARGRRCDERCRLEGYTHARIGPSSERDPHNPHGAAYVACICEKPGEVPLELRADELR